jgi:membrane protease YdiL (CAAX protease family)
MAHLLKRALDFHFSILWLAVVLLLPLIVGAAAIGLYILSTGHGPALGMLSQPIMILPAFLMIFFLQGPVPEEFGWRGYLLDRFQARWSPLVASLLMGIIWAVWHLPSWFMDGTYQSFAPFWAFTIFDVAVTVLFTWIYNHTRGNLFLALLFHTMINLANSLFLSAGEVGNSNSLAFLFMTALYALTAIVVVVVRRQQLLIKTARTVT